jgi:hypothetical protein
MNYPSIDLWGINAPLEPCLGGNRNLVFRTRGLSVEKVFKSTKRSPDALGWLLDVHRLARQCGFVVPSLIASVHGRLSEGGWTCEEFVDGTPFSSEDMPKISQAVQKFHALAVGLSQRPGFASSTKLVEMDVGGDIDLAAMPLDLAQTCRSAWSAFSGFPLTIVHGDLNVGNLIHCPDGRAALIDWDECRRDVVIFDLGQLRSASPIERKALLAWEVACSWQIEPEHAQQVAERLRGMIA